MSGRPSVLLVMADQLVPFIERSRVEQERPFFLVVSYHHPHDPSQVTGEPWNLDEGMEIPILLSGGEDEGRTVLSEYHVEKVRAPCFMARRGPWKYLLVHGHGEQLFDLQDDPGEWRTLTRWDYSPVFDATTQYVR